MPMFSGTSRANCALAGSRPSPMGRTERRSSNPLRRMLSRSASQSVRFGSTAITRACATAAR